MLIFLQIDKVVMIEVSTACLQNAVVARVFLNLGCDSRDSSAALFVHAADGRDPDPDPYR